jgi:hypothetical protein
MVFLIISWAFLFVAAVIGIYHLRIVHLAKKKSNQLSISSTLSEREMLIIYDLERERDSKEKEMC